MMQGRSGSEEVAGLGGGGGSIEAAAWIGVLVTVGWKLGVA
jgi:hypothetical protein